MRIELELEEVDALIIKSTLTVRYVVVLAFLNKPNLGKIRDMYFFESQALKKAIDQIEKQEA